MRSSPLPRLLMNASMRSERNTLFLISFLRLLRPSASSELSSGMLSSRLFSVSR